MKHEKFLSQFTIFSFNVKSKEGQYLYVGALYRNAVGRLAVLHEET